MKKKTRRLLLFIIFLVLPAMAIGAYIVHMQFEGNMDSFAKIYEELSKRGIKELVLGKLFDKNDIDTELDNESIAQEERNKEIDARVPVTVFTAFVTGFRDTLPALGNLKGHRETKLGFEKTGIIKSFNFKEGDLVYADALIASLEKEEAKIKVRHAEAKLNEAKASLSLAKNKLNRITQKFKLGGTSESLYEEALLEYQRSTHILESTKIDNENAMLDLKKCDLFAPFEGVLGNKYVEEGETVTPNTLVCDLIDVSYMVVEIGIVERDIEKIVQGQRVSVFVDAYPEREFIGTVEMISPVVEGQSRTFSVEIKLSNPQKLLLPGMFARVKINVFEQKNALIIPTSALVRFRNKYSVFVVNEEAGTVTERPVTIIYSSTDYAVIARGLKEGELVVIGDKEGIGDGSPVKVIEHQVPEI